LLSESGFSSTAKARWWEFEISCDGRRAIMNDVASAIGLEQLRHLPRFIARRRKIDQFYNHALMDFDWLQLPPALPAMMESSYYLYWVQTEPNVRDRLARYLLDHDIYTTFRYYPLHRVRFYGDQTSLPNTEEVAESTLCLPLHQALTDADLDRIVQCISDFAKRA